MSCSGLPAGLKVGRDQVARHFTATAAKQLWVTDLTCVPTWAGVANVCFIIDAYSRVIVGWRAASTLRTETVLDASEMARWSRGTNLVGLRCHSDAESQFTSLRYGERRPTGRVRAGPSMLTEPTTTRRSESYSATLYKTQGDSLRSEGCHQVPLPSWLVACLGSPSEPVLPSLGPWVSLEASQSS
ncbi:hypothetical protein GCM10025875_17960 [Litorihabitans aurantiacus]|uniref:Integrase catalytic domain-containing protein n=1 Tax=Litorihabitans aurantiacus TaxID=1930061 RepID=A0AA37XEP9_9MICO|nr:hypothetical protein GCM10025875_17960 [Litorihabitans aurantiacus]